MKYLILVILSVITWGCKPAQTSATSHQSFSEPVYTKLREKIKSDLPTDYLEFLKGYDGTLPKKSFWVVPNDWGSGIGEIYTMQETNPSESLLQIVKWEGIPLKTGLLPIGGDGSFGYILLSIRSEDYGTIYFCCPWSKDGKTDIHEGQGYWKIADNFSSFLNKLQKEPK